MLPRMQKEYYDIKYSESYQQIRLKIAVREHVKFIAKWVIILAAL